MSDQSVLVRTYPHSPTEKTLGWTLATLQSYIQKLTLLLNQSTKPNWNPHTRFVLQSKSTHLCLNNLRISKHLKIINEIKTSTLDLLKQRTKNAALQTASMLFPYFTARFILSLLRALYNCNFNTHHMDFYHVTSAKLHTHTFRSALNESTLISRMNINIRFHYITVGNAAFIAAEFNKGIK